MIISSTPIEGGSLSGRFIRHKISTQNLEGGERGVTVRLPDSYDPERKAYPVVYLQDGQNMFDYRTAFNNQEWKVDETVNALTATGQLTDCILVAIDNGEARMDEFTHLPDPDDGAGRLGKAYEKFVVDELLPSVEGAYSINPKNRVLLGSSLGGLATTSIGIAHPGLFAGLGPMSSSAWWSNGEIADRILATDLENGPKPRIWMDMGTEEGKRDANGTREIRDGKLQAATAHPNGVQDVRDATREAAIALLHKGWKLDENLRYHEPLGGTHTEYAWGQRVGEVLTWLMKDMSVTEK